MQRHAVGRCLIMIPDVHRCVVEWGWINPAKLPARLDILIFALGCGAISHCYSDDHGKHRDVFRSKYLNVLDIIFGNSGETQIPPAAAKNSHSLRLCS